MSLSSIEERRPETAPERDRRALDRVGVFVTFEGIEGCGKTTQLANLAARLRESGRDVVTTREPGGTALGRDLRTLLLGHHEVPPTATAELLLYAADRAQHLEEVVEPALARGAIVLCDRFLDATLAYQGYGRGLGCEAVLAVHRRPPLDRRPDRTMLLDLDPAIGVVRARSRNDAGGLSASEGRFEAEAIAFHERVRDGYLLIAAQAERVRVVDADGTVDEVGARVWAAVHDVVA